jgi:OPA family sugar phosphate sensor protein UhpC-like MFS transporter
VSGWLGDRVGARRLIGHGMLLSAACCIAFGSAGGALLFGLFFVLNGFAQSTGWPGTTRAMAEWTTLTNRGKVMAVWATCYMVGGLVANSLAGEMLHNFGWRAAFYGPAALIICVALLILVKLRTNAPAAPEGLTDAEIAASRVAERKAAQARVLKNPVLWCYGISYFFIKFIRYTLLFWLPYYLSEALHYSGREAAHMSNAFEVGGIVGVVVIGAGSDRIRRYSRAFLGSISLILLVAALFFYAKLGSQGMWQNVLVLGLIGATLFGPDSLISGAAAQDAGGVHAASMATGFVNGVGSIGAMAQGLVVPAITNRYGWQALFPVFMGFAVLAALALIPTFRRGAREPR